MICLLTGKYVIQIGYRIIVGRPRILDTAHIQLSFLNVNLKQLIARCRLVYFSLMVAQSKGPGKGHAPSFSGARLSWMIAQLPAYQALKADKKKAGQRSVLASDIIRRYYLRWGAQDTLEPSDDDLLLVDDDAGPAAEPIPPLIDLSTMTDTEQAEAKERRDADRTLATQNTKKLKEVRMRRH